MMKPLRNFFLDIDYYQYCKHRQYVAGDVFLSHKLKEDNRFIAVLSDGLGSGIKASVLATLTATMALKYISNYADIRETAEVIMDTLPVCSVRKISYSTFTIVDINSSGHVRVIEHGNPAYVLMRQTESVPVEKTPIQLKKWYDREVSFSEFDACIGDRILYFSDGVSQAGMGRPEYPLGWGRKNVIQQLKKWISWEDDISSRVLAMKTAIRARQIDGYEPKDDITCGVMYLRHPRSLLVVTGPPYSDTKDAELAQMVDAFEGRKVICGGTTASIIGRELDRDIDMNLDSLDPDVPPSSVMEGVDLITEGTLTLSKVADILERGQKPELMRANAATTLASILLDSDIIFFVVGTRINEAHQDPNLPVELDIRRNIIKKITNLLEEKYLKETHKRFI
ncbi:MAG TPA: SpoIIE family protein phosphatase [Syntrophobacter fumaroxidans]|nr:SpoIIE family protein phosphatase [Syntrophobacter fumaroxidans]